MSMYLRILRKEGYNQLEMDKLFISLVRNHAGGGAGGVFAPPPPTFSDWLPRSVTYSTNKV